MATSAESAKLLTSQYVTFLLGDETYGISILKLNEIIAYQDCTTIPNVPNFIKGVLNLRGIVVPVIDLRERFSMETKTYDQFTVIMILDVSGRIMGLIVDAVSDVITLNKENIKPRPSFSAGISTHFIQGMGVKDNKFIILLDVDRLLSDEELNLVDGV
ncbi:MAG: purine-binding chemotaxis protein CheW [Deltaproteobacteria bacterium]|nr:purine-binding chemotaxis protein CheW [Deltaproteobacteria bacterium]